MRFALFPFIVAALSVQQAVSFPLDQRASSTSDIFVLQIAATLELLENAFYKLALEKFCESDFIKSGLSTLAYRRFVEIASHENKHVELLTTALGDQAPQACNYSFPITDVKSFTHLSQLLEDVGVAAYTGAMPLLTSPGNSLLAASISATEARHETWVSVSVNNGVPWGSELQVSLTLRQALTAASRFILSCPPTNPNLVTPFPDLSIISASQGRPVFPGDDAMVQFTSNLTATYIAFYFDLSTFFVPIKNGTVAVPVNMSGQVYAIATTSRTEVTDDNTVAGPAILLFETSSNGNLTN